MGSWEEGAGGTRQLCIVRAKGGRAPIIFSPLQRLVLSPFPHRSLSPVGTARMDAKSLSSSSVASRFVSQTQLTEAQKKREEDIRAAYARMGQSPPPEAFQSQEDYDPRTLYDKLKANTDAKQEAFDEKMKLSNQFRGIDDAESEFLADIARQRTEDQKKREEETRQELEEFRRWVAYTALPSAGT